MNAQSNNTTDFAAEAAKVLTAFLEPLAPEAFIGHEWGRQPLHLRGRPSKVVDIFDLERFHRSLARASATVNRRGFRISAVVEDFDGMRTCTEAIELEDVEQTLAQGITVCVHDIGVGDEQLSAFGESIQQAMNFAGVVSFNCYLRPMDQVPTHTSIGASQLRSRSPAASDGVTPPRPAFPGRRPMPVWRRTGHSCGRCPGSGTEDGTPFHR